MARLFVLSGHSIGETHDIDATSVLGRANDVDVTIPDVSVSRRHARLVPQQEPGLWGILDLKSANGVFVDGRRVSKGLVRTGETFRLGEVEIRLRDDEIDEGPEGLDWEDEEENEPAAAAAPNAEVDELETGPELESGLELEFEGDLDEALRAPLPAPGPASGPAPAKGAPASSAKPPPSRGERPREEARAGAIASQERAARRRQAMGGADTRQGAVADGGRPILQYAKVRSGGTDLAQLPAWQKWIVGVLAVGLLCAAAYGAFSLTAAAKGGPAIEQP